MRADGTVRGGRRQQGVAAIELTLVLGLLIVVVMAAVSFSVLFMAQQRLNHLVGEAARQSAMRPYLHAQARDEQFSAFLQRQAVEDALLSWVGSQPQGSYVQEACIDNPSRTCGVFSVLLPLQSWYLVGLLDLVRPLLMAGGDAAVIRPAELRSRAVVMVEGGGA